MMICLLQTIYGIQCLVEQLAMSVFPGYETLSLYETLYKILCGVKIVLITCRSSYDAILTCMQYM